MSELIIPLLGVVGAAVAFILGRLDQRNTRTLLKRDLELIEAAKAHPEIRDPLIATAKEEAEQLARKATRAVEDQITDWVFLLLAVTLTPGGRDRRDPLVGAGQGRGDGPGVDDLRVGVSLPVGVGALRRDCLDAGDRFAEPVGATEARVLDAPVAVSLVGAQSPVAERY